MSNFLRVGYEADGSWRVVRVAQGFSSGRQDCRSEDDITASVVVPAAALRHLNPDYSNPSVKFVHNAEARLFQRPDEAIHRGYDKQTEHDLSEPGNFLSNFQPLTAQDARELVEDAIGFETYTEPMRHLILDAAADGGGPRYFVSSAHPRVVDGQPSKNPRYLQKRPDLVHAREAHGAEMATRLQRRISLRDPVYTPVNAVVPGRRNNPPDAGRAHPLAGGVQSDPLHGIARVVHGVHLEHDGQIPLDHRRRLGRRADQGAVQRAAADH